MERSDTSSTKTNHFVYKLIPPRPTFGDDMTQAEAGIMTQHFGYWQALTDKGIALVYGPIADPGGMWGLAVVEAETEDDVRALGVDDPAVRSQMATFEVFGMPDAIVRS